MGSRSHPRRRVKHLYEVIPPPYPEVAVAAAIETIAWPILKWQWQDTGVRRGQH